MGLALTVGIAGVEKLVKDFQKKKKAANDLLPKAIKKGAFQVEADAKKIAPVETGFLRSNISHEMSDIPGEPTAIVGVRDIVDYAVYVEFMADIGKAPVKPGKRAPFLYPSLQKNQKLINDLIKEAIIESMKY